MSAGPETRLRAPGDRASSALCDALRQVPEAAAQDLLVFHDLDAMTRRIDALKTAFPDDALHAVAIKANPVVGVLEEAVAAGAGLEAASFEEATLAQHAGCAPERIVFDSPAKTRGEIRAALERGFYLNADSFDELERIDQASRETRTSPHVGLRVNPQVGAGTIAITSVSTRTSKFGVPLAENADRIVEAFRRHEWLRGLHVHVGSQGCSLEQLIEAGATVAALVERIDQQIGPGRVATVDIGGGLPYRYTERDVAIALDDYVAALRCAAPRLFQPDISLITEFGRWLQAGCGWIAARVEYVKRLGGENVAICHAGADLLMRPVYQPETWQHRFSVLDGDGRTRDGETASWTFAGPLCFAGDIVLRQVESPGVEPGDWLILHDAGAYTLSMWSRHCSRGLPMVIGYRAGEAGSARVLLEPESPADVADFWSRGLRAGR